MWTAWACHAQVMRLLLLLDDKDLDINNFKHRKVLNMLQVIHDGMVIASPHNIAWILINNVFEASLNINKGK
jgi:hypothetical protein